MKSKAPTGALQTVTTTGVVKVSAHLWFKAHSCSLDLCKQVCPFQTSLPTCCLCVCVLCWHAAHSLVDRGWQCWYISVVQTSTCPISWLTFWRSLLLCPAEVPSLMCLQLHTHLHCLSSECFAISLLLCLYSFRWLHVSFAVQHCPPCSLLVLLHILWNMHKEPGLLKVCKSICKHHCTCKLRS